jgi:uncharacterized protein
MEADRWIDRVVFQRDHLAEAHELATLEEELRGLAASLRAAQDALAPVRSAYEDAERDADRLGQRARALEAALAASTAKSKELAALHGELEHVRALTSLADDRELELLVELEPLEEAVTAIKALAQPHAQRRHELQGTVRELRASLDEELVSLRRDRERRAGEVTAELRARYDYAMSRSGTSGAAQLDGGRCDGCRLALSPLDLGRLKAMPEGTLMACPECSRLLLP